MLLTKDDIVKSQAPHYKESGHMPWSQKFEIFSWYKNQEEYQKDIERVFLEDYNVTLSPDKIQKIWEEIKNICSKFLQ
ncbi:MAG: hypothetical protein ACD_71C00215G0002 [uncultured bacterium (gcode 4)]|uniref:Uncharacterized protein n=1 Tax=uncultured bacterium (gcode 4) TaxID=1234023 RepID=K1YMM2_9BACT|nr:MAG: hypothetical protein ACD_71C00215G0002 [uncultured bacterium (gcode 4)]